MNQHSQSNDNSRMLYGIILWIIALICFFGVLLFSIGLFQRLSYGDESSRLELLVLLLGLLNASSISGSIFLVSRKE
ncbi:MAG: hypothetical protein ACFFAE_11340 [Candidatus Hodarchaeota archaeon]